jgi:hypothetical protein|tara:strand:- start:351 stop:500 length:150 start_codon:yes stop_codon:yes gene_type:complete
MAKKTKKVEEEEVVVIKKTQDSHEEYNSYIDKKISKVQKLIKKLQAKKK